MQQGPAGAEVGMLRQMFDMPTGTIGFEASGEVDDDDFEDIVAPVLRRQIATGAKVRLLYLLGPEMREYDGDALSEEMKFAARHPTAYERVAVVSDESWLRPGLRVLSVLVPGQLRAFPVAELQAAKRWVGGDDGEQAAGHGR
jgi:stage II sporulation SpoAA-like protein